MAKIRIGEPRKENVLISPRDRLPALIPGVPAHGFEALNSIERF
jgi:hypothetical protein